MRNILHWVNFLLLKIFSNIFCSTFCYIPFIFYYCQQLLLTLRVLLLSPLNDESVNIADDEASCFVFFWSWVHITLIHSHRPCNRHWSRITVLRTTTTVKNMSKLLIFKWLLNELMLEIELSEVLLIGWFISIKFIRYFLKLPFLISVSLEKLSLFHLQILSW